MAGPNLEVFKFGLYMFFPIWIMLKFGDPDWYAANVQPYKEILWPAYDLTHRPPRSQPELQAELARLKAERAAKRERLAGTANSQPNDTNTDSPSISSPVANEASPNVGIGQVEAELGRSGGSVWAGKKEDRLV